MDALCVQLVRGAEPNADKNYYVLDFTGKTVHTGTLAWSLYGTFYGVVPIEKGNGGATCHLINYSLRNKQAIRGHYIKTSTCTLLARTRLDHIVALLRQTTATNDVHSNRHARNIMTRPQPG